MKKKKLFRVVVESVIYVMAKDEQQAERIARSNINQEMDCVPFDTHVEISSNVIDSDWKDCIPYCYGLGDNRTCDEIMGNKENK